jgi:hypothetical protein
MDNQETLVKLGTQDIGHGKKKRFSVLYPKVQAYVQLSVNTQLLCYYIIFGFKTVVLDSWSINILILNHIINKHLEYEM